MRHSTAAAVVAACLSLVPRLMAQMPGFQNVLGHLANPTAVSTVPSNGDVNPYGVAFVPAGFAPAGLLQPGDILVSNFNNSQNLQGTGTTIVDIRNGQPSLFFQGRPGLGLTTALRVLKSGLVLVGNLPTTDGTSATARPGSLLVIDASGRLVRNFVETQLINGPWNMTVSDMGSTAQIFISNVLSGTVTRLDVSVTSESITLNHAVVIGSGFGHRGDPAALEVGPTGLAYDPFRDVLYVAATLENAIYAIPRAGQLTTSAGKGVLVYSDPVHLHGPLGLTLAPNGDLLATNGDAINPDPLHSSELLEFTPGGKFVAQMPVDPSPGGAFGLRLGAINGVLSFAAVDDNQSNITIWSVEGNQLCLTYGN